MPLSISAAASKDRNHGAAKFEHRHFATIAEIIRDMDKVHNGEHGFVDIREDVAEEFANALARTNPRFDRERFLSACRD